LKHLGFPKSSNKFASGFASAAIEWWCWHIRAFVTTRPKFSAAISVYNGAKDNHGCQVCFQSTAHTVKAKQTLCAAQPIPALVAIRARNRMASPTNDFVLSHEAVNLALRT
jgi:hypothetical protein